MYISSYVFFGKKYQNIQTKGSLVPSCPFEFSQDGPFISYGFFQITNGRLSVSISTFFCGETDERNQNRAEPFSYSRLVQVHALHAIPFK
jgi:hypothetical protein